MRIRDFRMEDYEQVMSIWSDCSLPLKPNGRDSRERIEREIRGTQCNFLVAVDDDARVVGTILGTHDGRKGWINRLAVVPERRGEGIARTLMVASEEWLMSQGIGIFACLIEGHNPAVMGMVEHLGYSEFVGVRYFTKRYPEDI